ncbi:hypothetical protein SAMN00777080_2019 [Aquiflexum balticum DSM 16537]|uniref:Uncharacterized protein n=1 Tax=Aquiflexum balticum DSM 16537 TaxID=758820 RepID=A0A1W2H3A3_9BACT|nr:hypothetical protein SAMN00777080_2019 [Aquiflexum balticum DSM 16537]
MSPNTLKYFPALKFVNNPKLKLTAIFTSFLKFHVMQ